jgi:DNA polymerase III alpha subunit
MLHLLGYDHELSKKDAEEMQKQEAKIFEGIIKDKKTKDVVYSGLRHINKKSGFSFFTEAVFFAF